jgi:hypothetical protein
VGHRAGVNPGNLDRGDNELSWPTSIHAARRFVMTALPHASAVELGASESEPRRASNDPPVLQIPELIEEKIFRAIRVIPERNAPHGSGFTGFLDGTEDIRVVNHCDGIPIVWATVSAAVRVRRNKRLIAWTRHEPAIARKYYLPLCYLDDVVPAFRHDPRVVDTATPDSSGAIPSRHPAALLDRAIQKVQTDREALERLLAEAWCEEESSPLYVDGSITASAVASGSRLAIGVVKSHRTLYAEGDAFGVVIGLRAGERSSAFVVPSRSRHSVASWYLRLRNPSGRDALFGLVRVEAALGDDITARADEISRWIIAEGSPLSLPDGRWDKMSYGIRDAEEFLRAIS